MGAWGKAPWENDAYGDLTDRSRSEIGKKIVTETTRVLDKAERSSDENDWWGAIGAVIIAYQSWYPDFDQMFEPVNRAIALWEKLGTKREWLASWHGNFSKMYDAVGIELNSYLEDAAALKWSPLISQLFAEFESKRRR